MPLAYLPIVPLEHKTCYGQFKFTKTRIFIKPLNSINKTTDQKIVLKQLQKIPGIGKACSLDLWNIGIRSISDLKEQNPSRLFNKLNTITGATHDICMLYTLRCAVYFATEKHPDKNKLNWWYWKNNIYNE